MNGYMIFSLDEDDTPVDSFYICENLEKALVEHSKNFNLSSPCLELAVRSSVPYVDKSEKEVTIQDGKEVVVKENSPDYSRCLFCMDFYPLDSIYQVAPFGDNNYETACGGCKEYENL